MNPDSVFTVEPVQHPVFPAFEIRVVQTGMLVKLIGFRRSSVCFEIVRRSAKYTSAGRQLAGNQAGVFKLRNSDRVASSIRIIVSI